MYTLISIPINDLIYYNLTFDLIKCLNGLFIFN